MHQPLTISERPLTEVREEVIEAGNKYIDTIVNEQKELDPFYLDNPFYLQVFNQHVRKNFIDVN